MQIFVEKLQNHEKKIQYWGTLYIYINMVIQAIRIFRKFHLCMTTRFIQRVDGVTIITIPLVKLYYHIE